MFIIYLILVYKLLSHPIPRHSVHGYMKATCYINYFISKLVYPNLWDGLLLTTMTTTNDMLSRVQTLPRLGPCG